MLDVGMLDVGMLECWKQAGCWKQAASRDGIRLTHSAGRHTLNCVSQSWLLRFTMYMCVCILAFPQNSEFGLAEPVSPGF